MQPSAYSTPGTLSGNTGLTFGTGRGAGVGAEDVEASASVAREAVLRHCRLLHWKLFLMPPHHYLCHQDLRVLDSRRPVKKIERVESGTFTKEVH